MKEIIDKLDFIKIEDFSKKYKEKRTKTSHKMEENIFREQISKIYKEHLKLINKRVKNVIKMGKKPGWTPYHISCR